MSNNHDFVPVDFTKAAIAELQRELLDFSTRNWLLSFKHSERRLDYVRAVDELPTEIFRRLSNGGMQFKALPHPSLWPADEETKEFKQAVAAAMNSDAEFKNAIEKRKSDGRDAAEDFKINRSLRDKVRRALNRLPILVRGDKIDINEHARANGICPDYQLPYPDGSVKEVHTDKYIQTLLLPDDLERRMRKVYDAHQEHIQEKGINVLHAAFGFLEWYEDDVSTVAHHAPLLLVPLSLIRKLGPGQNVYTVTAEGDEVALNVTLLEFLKQKHQITLPPFLLANESDSSSESGPDEASTVEPWLAQVAEAIAPKRRWKVCRFVTVGTFPFSRMAIHKDLNAQEWACDALARHEGVQRLLGGLGRNDGDASSSVGVDHPIDDPTFSVPVPSIILEADSSQHSAIVDAMAGSSFVIQGPPGTGKSQTIANLIAAAIDNNKRVLFLAEKSAALNVVASRLKGKGLAPYLFEVHSDKARKADVITSLRDRLDVTAHPAPADLERKVEQQRILRGKLARYVSVMGKPIGALGRPLHTLMWQVNRGRYLLKKALPHPNRDARISNAMSITQRELDQCRSALDAFAAARDAVISSGQSLSDHPWSGVAETNRFNVKKIVECARVTFEKLSALNDATNVATNTELELPRTASSLRAWLDETKRIPDWGKNPELTALALRHQQFLARLVEFFSRQQASIARLNSYLVDPQLLDPQRVEAIVTSCANLKVSTSRASILAARSTTLVEQKELESLLAEQKRLLASLGLTADLSTQDALAVTQAVLLLQSIPNEVLEARTPAMQTEGSYQAIVSASSRARALLKKEVDLSRRLDVARARIETTSEALYKSADALKTVTFFSSLGSEVRRAKKLWRSLSLQKERPSSVVAASELCALAAHLSEAREFSHSPRNAELFGASFEGHHSSFELYAGAAAYLRSVATVLAGASESVSSTCKRRISEPDAHVLQQLKLKLPVDGLERLASRLTELSETGETLNEALARVREHAATLTSVAEDATKIISDGVVLPADCDQLGKSILASELQLWQQREHEVKQREDLRKVFGTSFDELFVDCTPLRRALSDADNIRQAGISESIVTKINGGDHPAAERDKLLAISSQLEQHLNFFQERLAELGVCAQFLNGSLLKCTNCGDAKFADLLSLLKIALESEESLPGWMQYRQAANNTLQLPCNEIARLFESDSSVQPRLADVFEISLAHTMITEQLGTDARDLAEMTGPTLNDTRQKFSALDREIMALDARRISAKASRRPIDIGSDQGPKSGWTELSLIENEVKKKKRHLPLRDLIKRSNKALRSLKPVWLMSPLSAAQYLPRESDFFDLVVIDEASQMKPADAIGSIARARQVIVVGDPMQLPPTDFFGASAGSVEGQEGAASDQSSILDLAEARLRRRRMLRWHYRSRHESLIAFSNKHFYQSRLVVFPAATKSVDLGVEQIYVGGRYITGGTNPDEAKAVIEQARQMIDQFPNLSIGIVTTNGDQRELVLEEFEKLSADNRDVASYRAKWQSTLEPIFIKNLENVQGDERDIILISTVFGPDESGRVAQRFGPINSASGHRRLNVLFTRAKRKLIIVTSLKSADIIPGNSTNEGVHILKQFLEFSKTGRIETGVVSDGEPDSDFEVHVAQMLRQAGYEAVPQVGVHGFRIDIGVRHASFPDGFLAGIECDGATYHSGVTVRDRDRLRQEMLEGLGWQLYRIWSTDWFTNPEKEMQRLVAWLEALRDVKATTTSMVKVA